MDGAEQRVQASPGSLSGVVNIPMAERRMHSQNRVRLYVPHSTSFSRRHLATYQGFSTMNAFSIYPITQPWWATGRRPALTRDHSNELATLQQVSDSRRPKPRDLTTRATSADGTRSQSRSSGPSSGDPPPSRRPEHQVSTLRECERARRHSMRQTTTRTIRGPCGSKDASRANPWGCLPDESIEKT